MFKISHIHLIDFSAVIKNVIGEYSVAKKKYSKYVFQVEKVGRMQPHG